jgi:hypothetical protein
MKHLFSAVILIAIFAVPVFAHGDNDHVRGTVTAINAQSIVVTTTGAAPRTLTLDAKTVFMSGGKAAHAGDVKVGDRVVVDVPKKTDRAAEVNFSKPAPAARTAQSK